MYSSFLKKYFKARFMLAALCGISFASHLDAIRTADELARFEKQVQREMTHPTTHLKKVLATYKALRHAHLEAGGQGAEARMRQMIDNMRTAIRTAKTRGAPHLQRSLRGLNPFTGHQVTIHIARPVTPPIGQDDDAELTVLRREHAHLHATHAHLTAAHDALQLQHGALQRAHRQLQRDHAALRAQLAAGHNAPQDQPPDYHAVFPHGHDAPQQVPAAQPASHHSGLLGAHGHGLPPTYTQVAGHIPPPPPLPTHPGMQPPPAPHLLGQGGHGQQHIPTTNPHQHIGGIQNDIIAAAQRRQQRVAQNPPPPPRPAARPQPPATRVGNLLDAIQSNPRFQALHNANNDDED